MPTDSDGTRDALETGHESKATAAQQQLQPLQQHEGDTKEDANLGNINTYTYNNTGCTNNKQPNVDRATL